MGRWFINHVRKSFQSYSYHFVLLHTKVRTDLYADNATLYEINRSKQEIKRQLQLAIKDLASWCKHNGMIINSEKTKAMLVTTHDRDIQE